MAVEDLHWIDNSSEESFKYLLEGIPGARVLLIFTYRPEFLPTWGGRSYHNQVTLNRLSNRESLSMVTMKIADIQTGGDNQATGKTCQTKEKASPLRGAANKDNDARDYKRESSEMGYASMQDGLR